MKFVAEKDGYYTICWSSVRRKSFTVNGKKRKNEDFVLAKKGDIIETGREEHVFRTV